MYEDHFHEDAFTGEIYPQSIYHNEATLKWMGNDQPAQTRVDAGLKVRGQAKFANEILLGEMAYVKFLRCPHSHAEVLSIDKSAAEALPGVLKVYTNDDVPTLVARPPNHWVLQKVVYQESQPVAAVVATEEDICEEAISLITVDYDVRPFILHAEDSRAPGAPIIFGDTNENGSPFIIDVGDTQGALAAAATTIETKVDTVTSPWSGDRHTSSIECESATALWDGHRIQIWTSTQNPHGQHRTTAAQLDIPYNRAVHHHTYGGVGFGSKGIPNKGMLMAAYASRDLNVPVKHQGNANDQHSEMNDSRSCQSGQHHEYKIGMDASGMMTAISDINNQAAGCWGGRGSTDASRALTYMCNNPNLYIEGHDWVTNTNGAGVPRCVQHPQAQFCISSAFDIAAEASGLSPADFARKNVSTREGLNASIHHPEWEMDNNPNPGMLERIISDSGIESKWKGWTTPVSENGAKKRGIGMAWGACRHGYLANPQSCHIFGNPDGTFQVSTGSQDHGTGNRTAFKLMAAEELGVTPDKVSVSTYETDQVQESVGTGGSRVTRGSGTAVILACRDVKEQMFITAIDDGLVPAGTNKEDLEIADNEIYNKADSSMEKVPVATVTNRARNVNGHILGVGRHRTKRVNWMHQSWNMCVAEVEVDTDTGEVTTLGLWTEQDIGRTAWYKGSINQVHGGTTMSVGRALMEGMVKDEVTGIVLNPNYLDYKLMTHADIPTNYNSKLYENPDEFGPMGVKGIAEPACLAPAPAVAAAIYNACGARVLSTMITPNKVLAALGKA
jgi:CO/xanthine dehydrogenase Mo-binding subunit